MHEYKWEIIHDFKNVKLSGPLTALYSNQLIQQIANGLLGLFIPVFLYQRLQSFTLVALYFLVSYGLWFLLVPIGAKMMTAFGIKKSLIISVVFVAMYYWFFNFFDSTGDSMFLVFAILAINMCRMLYWIQFHTDFAKFTNRKTRGKQISLFSAIASLVAIFLPLISGFVLENYSFSMLFIAASFICLVSAMPLVFLPEKKEEFTFGYFESYKKAFAKKNRKNFISYAADGAQGFVGMVLWPLFIWLVMNESYSAMGIVSSVIILGSIVVKLVVGDYTDKFDKRKVMKYGTFLYSLGWVVKIFVATGFHIFLASTYHSFAAIVMRTPYDALRYEKAADSGNMVDEYNVLREISLNFGRVLMVVLMMGLLVVTQDINLSFIFAAGISLLINLI
ncbi:hypothetical protein COT97_01975 [Candidatus Falkowbacteria bacterium CG10_big_fil_rev_8_21_14_0_10_39_11]|uniref:Major facilitator superfamily (MFS) profile domain-containing protein n=1 Tax=Candidatus Falkowbacteria bacterium CG10_big_fil_rev_8_21_14_0_10_39_11 TaxID=1974565 RepID=A0A2H0V589_9BACT|nr:MAG: hypothetical protein COT97_01975 [Candidatus Falkowbacteria bacterium CG10_big_fil_rev_8_21_14_0_10_39_11]